MFKKMLASISGANQFDISPLSRLARDLYHRIDNHGRRYPETKAALKSSALYNNWWYYSVELLPGVVTTGIYPKDLPMLPRMLLRNCDLAGMDCLDLGSMEGLIPTLMSRQGARSVLATDATYHCFNKLSAIRHYHKVNFKFQQIGLMYDLHKKLAHAAPEGFDFINLSGVLYHVYSPMHVLAGVRPLLKDNALIVISTNVTNQPTYSMEFNREGRLQTEANTFWYISIPLFDYLLRHFKLLPIDCLYLPNTSDDSVRYTAEYNTGYLSVVCRATNDMAALSPDTWLANSWSSSWEWLNLCDSEILTTRPASPIKYKHVVDPRFANPDGRPISLFTAVGDMEPMRRTDDPRETHLLSLADQY